MPVHPCPNGKYRIGDGPCVYETKEKADRAYVAYLIKKAQEKKDGNSNSNTKRNS